jgi:hypothetical protein
MEYRITTASGCDTLNDKYQSTITKSKANAAGNQIDRRRQNERQFSRCQKTNKDHIEV